MEKIQDFEWLDDDIATGFILIDGKKWKVVITNDYPHPYEGDIDSDREMQRERNFDRVQQSIETGGTDY